jgi:hypothetical protein
VNKPHGSTEGLLDAEPYTSAGLQIGNFGGTGVALQMLGVGGGAIDAGIGFADRGLAAHGDFLFFFASGFKPMKLAKKPGYNDFRGKITPYAGGGVQLGKGVLLRVPVGVQYAMLRDPFNFYAAVALMAGPFLADDDLGANLGVMAGARVLL